MKRIFNFLIICVALVLNQACKKHLSDARYDSNDQLQIMDYVDTREDFSVFKELVYYVNQQNLLKTAGSYTVFVPTDAAFQQLFTTLSFEGKRITAIKDATPSYWLAFFRYHLLDRKINTNELEHGPMPHPTAYQEKYIITDISESYAALRLNNSAKIVEYNIEFANGYVNTLDEVLMPPIKTIYQSLQESGAYTTMLEIFEETGYLSYLKDSTITLLVESDEALSRSGFSREDIPDLEDWVKYHIIPDSGYFLNLMTAQRFYSLYSTEPISFQVDEFGQYTLNNQFRFNQSRELGIDQVGSNGIYHTLDTLLTITEAQAATIRLNLYPPGSPYGSQNVFTEAPARILLNTGTRSYHQNQEFMITQFDARQVGDYFWLTVPDVPVGKYTIRVMHRAGAARGKFLTIYDDQLIKSDINMAVADGEFEEWNYLVYNLCGEIEVKERSDVSITFAFVGFGSNPNPTYCCDLLMDIVELIPVKD